MIILPKDQKSELRRVLRQKRSARSNEHIEALSETINEFILMNEDVANSSTIAMYASMPTEPQMNLALKILNIRAKNIMLPILGDDLQRKWARFTSLADLKVVLPGRPPEPSSPHLDDEAFKEIDLFIIPALAVTKSGRRLGQGGGWYDHVLKTRRENVKVYAVLFEDEVLTDEEIPFEEHDVLIDGFFTQSGFTPVVKN